MPLNVQLPQQSLIILFNFFLLLMNMIAVSGGHCIIFKKKKKHILSKRASCFPEVLEDSPDKNRVFKCSPYFPSSQVHSQTWSPQISSSPTLQTGMCVSR